MKREQLRIDNLKSGHTLKDLHFTIFKDEVTHMVFDNVQTKSRFFQTMTGERPPDSGKVYYDESRLSFTEINRKISVISNESQLIAELSIPENIFLMREKVKGKLVNFRDIEKKTNELFKELGIEIRITKKVWRLTDSEKVQIEMSRAYSQGKKVIFLTGFGNLLSEKEMLKIQGIINKMKCRDISVVLVEPLENIDFTFCDRVIVIKNGRVCLIRSAKECDYMILHKCLYQDVADRIDYSKVIFFEEGNGSDKLTIRNLSSDYLQDVSLEITKGEILKLFCADEKSLFEIVNIIRGKSRIKSGYFLAKQCYDLAVCRNPLSAGIGIIEGNCVQDNSFFKMRVIDNLFMMLSHKTNGIWLRPKFKKSSQKMLENIISPALYYRTIDHLTPEEQQKVLYGKWFLYVPELLVCIQPFSAGNIQAREAAREMIYILKNRNIPILIITSNMYEINYCGGRTCYMHHGKMVTKEDFYSKI